IRIVHGHFLEAAHIRVIQFPRFPRDACRIHFPVHAAAPLDVPLEQPHQRIPARMNDCTNWRWKRRNATSSGALVISVASQMMDESMPWSTEENTCSPTVSGREFTVLLTMIGQRKLFQW